MNSDNRRGLSDHPVIVGFGLIAVLITIFIFVTGFENLSEIINGEEQGSNDEPNSTSEALSPTSTPTIIVQEDEIIPDAPIPSTPVPPTATVNNFLTRSDMDTLFGVNNWFCFPDRETGVAVKILPANFNVGTPLQYVDTWLGRFQINETTSQAAGATAELQTRLPKNECPDFQQTALSEWSSARTSSSASLDKSTLDSLFGKDNWNCLSDYAFGISINYLASPLNVEYPITVVDIEDSSRWGVGEVAPSGGRATIWLGGSIPREQCP